MKEFIGLFFLSTLLVVCCSCSRLPSKGPVSQPRPPQIKEDSRLYDLIDAEVNEQASNSGLLLLRNGNQALTERVYLADIAEQSIDAQYYIWNSDKSGKLLMQRLLKAAERGVSIRLLLDDFSIGDRNEQLLLLNSHPNVEVRIYNPFIMRSGVSKWINFIFDFERLNRRMHNKTFVVDQMVAITGGRNIGDEYFNQHEQLNFTDTDLLSIGPVVEQVAESFAAYWSSPWAVPIDLLLQEESMPMPEKPLGDFLSLDLAGQVHLRLPANRGELENHFQLLPAELTWAPAVFLADEPGGSEKDDAYSDDPKKVARHLVHIVNNSTREVLIESAYFVLNKAALELVAQAKARGVEIRALTNSMASNDVLPNHASYAMVREAMLEHGIELYELRPDAKSCLELLSRHEYCDSDSFIGLHAKAAVFDRETVYVGSLNFNLRSAYLNTEAAMIIESPVLAEQLAGQIELNMQQENSWHVVLDNGQVQWMTEVNGQKEISEHDPQTSWLERAEAGLLILVPGSEYY